MVAAGAEKSGDRVHLGEIDALRGIAAAGVAFFWHFKYAMGWSLPIATADRPLGWLQPFAWAYEHGDVLVELFFVLSGVVFHHVYRARSEPASASWSQFMSARIGRLYPLVFASTLLAAVLLMLGASLYGRPFAGWTATGSDLVRNLLLLQFWRVEPGSLNAPTWSISVEMLCYLLFLLLAKRSSRLFYAGSMIFAAIGLVSLSYVSLPKIDWFVARGLLGFFVGVLLYGILPFLRRLPIISMPVMLFLGVGWVMFAPAAMDRISLNAQMILFVWPWLILTAGLPHIRRLLETLPLRKLGDWSFSIYLLHIPVLMMLLLMNGNMPFPPAYWPLLQLVYAMLTLALSALSFRFLEVPARRWLRDVPARVDAWHRARSGVTTTE